MAILDKQLEFSDAQAVTATAASTNVIDLDTAAPNIGSSGTPIYAEVRVNTTCTSGGSATIDAVLQHSTDNSTFTTLVAPAQVAVAAATAGTVIMRVPLPAKHNRYLRINYTIGTANLTAGKFDAFLTTGHN